MYTPSTKDQAPRLSEKTTLTNLRYNTPAQNTDLGGIQRKEE